MPRKWRRSEKEKQKRRKVLPGFPRKGTFRTKEEIDAYFAGDKIQCLLCGKWYQKLSGAHLSHIHDMTDDEYRQRYGLPWARGLTAETTKKRQGEIAKRRIEEGTLPVFDGKDEQIQQRARKSPQRPPQPYATDLRRKHALTTQGRTTPWQRKDYEAILTRMQQQQRTLKDVCRDPDLPGRDAWGDFVKKNPEFAAKLQQVYFSLPYSIQVKSRKVSPQFRIDCQHLCAQGMTLKDIGETLGVSATLVRRILRKAGMQPVIKKGTIDEMYQLAKRHNGKCLSTMYINNKTKLLWECEQGHQWAARPGTIKKGHWCPYCAGKVKGTLEGMHQLAERRGGKCLSATYIDSETKLLWECEQGHQWKARPSDIKKGHWCPHCAGRIKLTIKDMQRIAERRGGKCLSATYINNKTKLLWQCAQGHQWEASPNNIIRGSWCPFCARSKRKGTREEKRQTPTPPIKRTPLRLIKMPDEIEGDPVTTSQESIERKPFTMSRLKKYSEKEKQKKWKVLPDFPWRGIFQTKEEIDAYFAGDKIQCLLCGKWYQMLSGSHLSRIHDMTADEYRQRYGLPWSQGLIAEVLKERRSEITKQLIIEGRIVPPDGKDERVRQKIRESPQRPSPLYATDVRRRCLLTAHGRTTPWQREDYEAILSRMQEQQRTLRDVCQDPDLPGEAAWRYFVKTHPEFAAKLQQVYFTLPYSVQLKSRNVSPQFRIDCQRLRAQGMTMKEIAKLLGVSSNTVKQILSGTTPVRKRLTLDEMHRLAKRRGGKCLSETYINSRTKLSWECEQGHQWEATPVEIKRGHWCPHCAGNVKGSLEKMRQLANWAGNIKGSLEKMQQLAKRRGGKCLSKAYINRKTKLLWECEHGHQWEAKPLGIKSGYWCPHCAGNIKRTLEEMQQLAKRRGGKCLSEAYINASTKLLWECEHGHQWEATPAMIKQGKWCPHCAGTIKGTLEEMQQLAKRRGGKCLSEAYINARTKLLWECEQGHQWEAVPVEIKRRHWCPYCAGNAKKTIEEMQQLAKRRGGKCLSKTYINRDTKLLWECEHGHQWKTSLDHIKKGQWCPHCTGTAKKTIEEMQQLAERRGGRCLSPTYTNNRTKLLWQCAQGHLWKTTPQVIMRGNWCPHCARNKRKEARTEKR